MRLCVNCHLSPTRCICRLVDRFFTNTKTLGKITPKKFTNTVKQELSLGYYILTRDSSYQLACKAGTA